MRSGRLTIPEKRYFWFMDAKYIIADSGGSSTSWGIVLKTNEVVFLQTASLHPKYALSADYPLEKLKEQFQELNVPLYFYGAGCSSESVQADMSTFLLQFGFSEVNVYPDTLAACRALYGNNAGWIAILGTGSVLVQYDGSEIINRVGGYGSLIGDEGSGFYFGKLLVQYLLRTEQWKEEWRTVFESHAWILSKLASADVQQWISSLGEKTAAMDFQFLHRENARLFVELYCGPTPELKQIAFIGSYGYGQKAVFEEVFQQHDIQIEKGISSPIKDLVSYYQMNE
jgi:glucosamine kinase